jgi:hypothetical protein
MSVRTASVAIIAAALLAVGIACATTPTSVTTSCNPTFTSCTTTPGICPSGLIGSAGC